MNPTKQAQEQAYEITNIKERLWKLGNKGEQSNKLIRSKNWIGKFEDWITKENIWENHTECN